MLMFKFFRLNIKKQLEYKLNFFLLCIAVIPINLLQLVFSVVLGGSFKSILNWNIPELIFLYCLLYLPYSIAQVFFRVFRFLDEFIVDGRLDSYFVRPQSVTYSIILNNLSTMEIVSQLFPSVVLLCYALISLGVEWNMGKIGILFGAIVGGTIIQSCIFIIIGLISFWTVKSNQITDIYFKIMNFAYYPMEIFSKQILRLLTYIIPLACINYYPAVYILGKGTDSIKNYLALPIGIMMIIMTTAIWKTALRNYKSTGS